MYDVFNMGNSWVKEKAFIKKELLERDIAFKQKFYYAKGSHYETATLKSISLLPKIDFYDSLEDDYRAMSNMIYGKKPSFKEMVDYLNILEKEVHQL